MVSLYNYILLITVYAFDVVILYLVILSLYYGFVHKAWAMWSGYTLCYVSYPVTNGDEANMMTLEVEKPVCFPPCCTKYYVRFLYPVPFLP